MSIELLDVTTPSLAYICVGGFVVLFSMLSLLVREKLFVNEVVLGTAFGVIIGPHVLNVFDPRRWTNDTNALTLEIMRVVLATGLFAIGVELPRSYMVKHVRGLLVFIVPTMVCGWLITSVIIHALFPSLTYTSSLVIGACLTPTDPIICSAILGGSFAAKHVPINLRRLLAAESAANDGMAYPFLSLSIYLTLETSKRVAVERWFLVGWLYEVILGVALGTTLGLGFSWMLKKAHQHGFNDRESFVAQYLALSLLTIGITATIGSDDLLAAFAAGNAVSWDGNFNTHVDGEVFASVIDLVLNCACFIYLGAWIPFNTYNTAGLDVWRLTVLFIAIIFLRRIPSTMILCKWVPEIETWKEALFSGHFGPMGIGTIFISTLALSKLPKPNDPPETQEEILYNYLHPIVSFIVLGSIMIHGLSVPFFSFGQNMSRSFSAAPTADGLNHSLPTSIPNGGIISMNDLTANTGIVHHGSSQADRVTLGSGTI